jgi:N-acetylneuraminate synthase
MTQPVIIITEIGYLHNDTFGNAQKFIESTATCGVDAVEFQMHIPEAETLPDAHMSPCFKGEPRFEYLKRISFSMVQSQTTSGDSNGN